MAVVRQALRLLIENLREGAGPGMNSLSAGNEAEEEYDDNGADDGDEDGVNQAASRRDADQAGEIATDDGADDAENGVGEEPVAAALHDFSGSPTGHHSYNDPPKEMHALSPCLATSVVLSHHRPGLR